MKCANCGKDIGPENTGEEMKEQIAEFDRNFGDTFKDEDLETVCTSCYEQILKFHGHNI